MTTQLCMCKDRALSACPGEWEPGCDLGNNPAHVRVYQPQHEGLGPLPEDDLRAGSFLILSRLQSGTENVVRLDMALAAVAAERERCAKVCDVLTMGGSDSPQAKGAARCARAIRGPNV